MRVFIYSALIILTIIGIGANLAKGESVTPEREYAEVIKVVQYEDQNSHFHNDVYCEKADGNVEVFDQDGFSKGDEVYMLIDEQGNYDKLQHFER